MYNRFNGPPNAQPNATPGTPATRAAANPYAAFPQGTRPTPMPQAPHGQPPQGATGPYAPFPPATRPAAPQGPTPPPRPPRTDLLQKGTVPQTPSNGPQTSQYANIPQTTPYANIPRTFATPPGAPQQPAVPGNAVGNNASPQVSGRSAQPPATGGFLPSAGAQPRQPYMARIPDFSNLPQRADNAPNNAVPGVRPSAPAQQQRPANDQHSAPAQGANPYGKLSAAIMNQAAYNLKHGGPAKENPYGSMHPVTANGAPGKAESPYGKMVPVEKAAPNAPGSQQQKRNR